MRRASKIYNYLLMPALTVMLLSCVNDNEICPSDIDLSDGITLNLSISTGNIATRTRTSNADPDAGIDAENFIDIEHLDYCVYILDDAKRIVQRYEPTTTMIAKEGNRYIYKMSGKFMPFTSQFQVMVMANWKNEPFSGNYTDNISLEATSVEDLYKDARNHNFTLEHTTVEPETVYSWAPKTGTAGIPMFGLSSVLDIRDSKLSVMDNIEIPMLRSLAKIEVVNKAPENYVSIVSCRLTKHNSNGRFIPDGSNSGNPDWNNPDIQVTKPSLPQNVSLDETNLTFIKSVDGKTFTAYVPEMNLGADNRPEIEVDVDINGIKKTYKLEFTQYDSYGKPLNGEENMYSALLRNHRYNFTIISIGKQGELDIKTKEEGWDDGSDDTFVFEDVSSMTAKDINFQWTTSTPEEQSNIVTVSKDNGAEGSFNMSKPTDGSWALSFAPIASNDEVSATGVDTEAFLIHIWDNNSSDWGEGKSSASGRIKGKSQDNEDNQVKFKITAKDENGTESPLKARLVLTATTIENVTVYVKLTTNEETNKAKDDFYYIITQQPNEE